MLIFNKIKICDNLRYLCHLRSKLLLRQPHLHAIALLCHYRSDISVGYDINIG